MCPEQARGEEMDHRGDLYSVGVILYELLTGQLPFAGKSTMDILLAHATEEPPPFGRVAAAAGVPKPVEDVVQACLAKDPAQRPAHARELAERFEGAVKESMTPEPTPPESKATPAETARPRRSPTRPLPARLRPAAPISALPAEAPPEEIDPLAVVHHLEAWMPETIASYKLRGFIGDAGGEVVESVPGRIHVRLGGKGSAYAAPSRGLSSWLGLGRRSGHIDMELRLHRPDAGRENQLRITVVLKSPGLDGADPAWQAVCTQIYCDLRGYLMGANGSTTSGDTVS
jgi:serine/threonine-protein kinase